MLMCVTPNAGDKRWPELRLGVPFSGALISVDGMCCMTARLGYAGKAPRNGVVM